MLQRLQKDLLNSFFLHFYRYLLKWLHHNLTFSKNNSMVSFYIPYSIFCLQKVKRYIFQRILVFGPIDIHTSLLRINPPPIRHSKNFGRWVLTTLDFSFSQGRKNRIQMVTENFTKNNEILRIFRKSTSLSTELVRVMNKSQKLVCAS